MGYYLLALLALLLSACGQVTPSRTVSVASIVPEPVVLPDTPCVVRTAVKEIGVKETGENSGPRVNQYLASTKLGPGFFWCASFCHWTLAQCGNTLQPAREFAAAARFGREHVRYKKGDLEQYRVSQMRISEDGNLFTLYYANLKRIGHVGVVIGETEEDLITVEGNTGDGGSRNGNGVFKRIRDKETIYTVNNW